MKKFRKMMALVICLAVCLMSVSVGFADGPQKTIFGKDGRRKVTDEETLESPYSAVCNLTIKWSNGTTTYGTGFLISDTRVVTTAHCLYNRKTGATAKSIIVAPGDRVSGHPFGRKTATSFHYPPEYAKYGVDYDYGYIELPSAFSTTVKPATLTLKKYSYNSDFSNKPATLIGFDYKTAQMYTQTETINYASDYRLYHKMDTLSGMSGSPILDSNGKVIGINAYSINGDLPVGNTVADDYPDYNKATRISDEAYAFLKAVKQEGTDAIKTNSDNWDHPLMCGWL